MVPKNVGPARITINGVELGHASAPVVIENKSGRGRSKDPHRLVEIPVEFELRCVHCLGNFPSPEPDRRCCPGCAYRKHNQAAKFFDDCPICRAETAESKHRAAQT